MTAERGMDKEVCPQVGRGLPELRPVRKEFDLADRGFIVGGGAGDNGDRLVRKRWRIQHAVPGTDEGYGWRGVYKIRYGDEVHEVGDARPERPRDCQRDRIDAGIGVGVSRADSPTRIAVAESPRSEEHTSEL